MQKFATPSRNLPIYIQCFGLGEEVGAPIQVEVQNCALLELCWHSKSGAPKGDMLDTTHRFSPVDDPERTYELLTAELTARVMDMRPEMHEGGQRQAAD